MFIISKYANNTPKVAIPINAINAKIRNISGEEAR
jgi:hypothetical protein